LTPVPTSPCPVCGATEATPAYPVRDLFLHVPGSWTFARCGCGHGTLAPMPGEAELEALYSRLYTPENFARMKQANESALDKGLRRARIKAVRAALSPSPTLRLLDVGCGLGHFVAELAEAVVATEARGVELGGPAADAAEARLAGVLGKGGGPRVLRQPFDAVTLEEPADVVSMNHFLEHHPRPERALAHAVSLVREGGLIEIEVPRSDGWGVRLLGRWWWGHLPPQHVHLFTRRGLEQALRAAGLEPVSWRICGYPMTLLAFWIHWVQHTIGRHSRFAGNGLMAAVSWLVGLAGVPPFALFDLTAGAVLNHRAGDIVMVVARRGEGPAGPG